MHQSVETSQPSVTFFHRLNVSTLRPECVSDEGVVASVL